MRALGNKAENDQDVVKMFRRFWADLGRQVFIPVSQEVTIGFSVAII